MNLPSAKEEKMMLKSKEVIGEDDFVEIPNKNHFSTGLQYNEHMRAKELFVPQSEYISTIDEQRGNES